MKRRILGALAALSLLGGCDSERRMFGASADALKGTAEEPRRESHFIDGPAPEAGKAANHRNVVNFAAKPGGGSLADAVANEKELPMEGASGVGGALAAAPAPKRAAPAKGGEASQEAAPTRSWFPESFLFEPLVVTDAKGRAAVDVPVPDRLTTWRVLALAHSREGAQAGTVARFLGTLPAYVDPVVPPFLVAGDEVRLPVQVVNTTSDPVHLPLHVDALGAEIRGANTEIALGPEASRVEYADLRTVRPGQVSLKAVFGNADAVSRAISVVPSGRPVTELRGGTLAAARTLEISGAADLLPESSRVRLLVFPGALGVLRSELGASTSRDGAAADAYALLLAGRAPALLKALGDAPDPEALRALALTAGQRVIRDARNPSVATEAVLVEAALAHPDNPVLGRIADRLEAHLAQSQRPDGTFEGGAGWTLQQVLVATARAVQAVRADQRDDAAKQRAARVTLKASGAFERNIDRVQDAYTAAALLDSGAVPTVLQERLRAKVREAVEVRPDGSRVLNVPAHVVRADGATPSVMEATAIAALALEGDSQAPWRADLGGALIGSYSPGAGWGDGVTNLAALRAVTALFQTPLPESIQITLSKDGKAVASGELSGTRRRDVLALEEAVADAAGPHIWTVEAKPAVPGLGFALQLQGYVPWKPEEMKGGLELKIAHAATAKVGEPVEVVLTAALPAGEQVRIRHALPAGVEADTRSLQALVDQGTITAFHTEPGAVVIEASAPQRNAPLEAHYRVIPTLAGTLHAQASSLEAVARPGQVFHQPPEVWAIR